MMRKQIQIWMIMMIPNAKLIIKLKVFKIQSKKLIKKQKVRIIYKNKYLFKIKFLKRTNNLKIFH